jgi:RNA polymerase sigma-70 factor (ECF subfamily)
MEGVPTDRIESIEQLHADWAGALFLYAWRRLGDAGAAEEAVQDTLVRAWRHADRFDPGRGSLPGWLFSIARNVTTDRFRRGAARPREVAELDDVDAPLTDAAVDRALEAWQLAEALHGLSREHREAIVEVHYLGYTVREVAEWHGLPEGTVKSRLYYGLRALRLRLEEMGVTG